MSRIFADLGLEFQRVSAIDGRKLTEEDAARWQPDLRGGYRTGEIGCFLSHRECWRRIVDEALPCAAIFEDDLHFGGDAASLLGGDAWIPEDADVVKIETKLYPTRIDKAPSAVVGTRRLYRLRGKHAGAGGYVVSLKGATKLLRMSETLTGPVDQFVFNPALQSAASLVTYQLFPAVCMQDFVVKDRRVLLGLGSDLHEERTERKPRGAAKLWREVKRPFARFAGAVGRRASNLTGSNKWASIPFE